MEESKKLDLQRVSFTSGNYAEVDDAMTADAILQMDRLKLNSQQETGATTKMTTTQGTTGTTLN